jgi:hypothetical protein
MIRKILRRVGEFTPVDKFARQARNAVEIGRDNSLRLRFGPAQLDRNSRRSVLIKPGSNTGQVP